MVPAQLHRDLFRRPPPQQQLLDRSSQRPIGRQLERLRAPRPHPGSVLRDLGPIEPVATHPIPLDLSADRRVWPTELPADLPQRQPIPTSSPDKPSLLNIQTPS